ncbi:PH domain-containing protein [Asticcacaulis sp. YBE204]|uniref:PH domain-containing protein n=1 Tax=Asticcacaulis sp. YBE204 TaxID=1282363 RepID=UPI0003C3B205|nr:PH domain-containing protein [Asticcacaulis sp. YBE204]ESQ80034.1 membrane protein [Asticcacaulis sp. YBE204]
MARYVDSALSAGEPILYDAKVHWAIFLQPFFRLWLYAIFVGFFYFFLGSGLLADISAALARKSSLSWAHLLSPILISIAVFCLIFGLSFLSAIVYYFNSDFVLTDRRVLSKFGLLSRTTSEQRLSKVESIHVYQSLIGRLLNFGNVTITGTGSSTTTFGPMADPIACKKAIEEQLDKERDRSGRDV